MRWGAPAFVAVVIALLALVPKISASAATPNLKPLTAQELIAQVQQTKVKAISGTIKLTVNGIPSLGSLATGLAGGGGGGFDPLTFLSGSHTATVAASPDGFKISYPSSSLSEQDLVTNGHDLWTWQSQGSKVTHTILPAKGAHQANGAEKPTAASNEQASGVQTPDQVAQNLLSKVQPTTTVSVTNNTYVANHKPAYQLVLKPIDKFSTVDRVVVAVDGTTFAPLRVQFFPKAPKGSPAAIDFGFTSISYTAPSAKAFTFTPPPGAKVTSKDQSAAAGKADAAKAPEPAGAPETADTPAKPDTATAAAVPGVPTTSSSQMVGHDWTTIGVFNPGQLPEQVNTLLAKGQPLPSAPNVPSAGKVTQTPLVNVVLLSSGKIGVGAVTPDSPLWAQAAAK
jgi:outer membrane lipoprotein-sorting protein